MYPDVVSDLIKVANEKVLFKTGQPLTNVQECILEQVLRGKRLKNIQVPGYADSTVQRIFCSRLWDLLSEATGQKVRINTVRLVLEKGLKEAKPAIAPPDTGIRPASLLGTIAGGIPPSRSNHHSSPPSELPKRIPHNLPAPSCTAFIGREEELNRLLDLLSPAHAAHLISVDGIGGVGKTTLVLEAAYRCLDGNSRDIHSSIPKFDVIIFTSAKEFLLTPFGWLKSLSPRRTLNDIFRQIARVIDDLDITGASFDEQVDLIRDALARQRTLLIVDNLETVQDQHDVLAFLYELPPTVKAVITTREQILFVPVRLTSMLEQDALSLIQHEAQIKEVKLEREDCMALNRVTGGIPVAISYAIGQLANGYSLQEVLHNIAQSTGDVARFCFASSVQPLQGKPAHRLLMSLALFPASALQDALIHVAVPDIDPQTTQTDLARLRGLSLVRQENNRYTMLPLTREYALTELDAHSDFAQDARERWLSWYLNFSELYAGQDAREWQGHQFDGLEEEWQNLQAVMDWCMSQSRYSNLLTFWHNVSSYTQVMGRHVSRLGYWDDRLSWTAWLIEAAQQRGDWGTAARLMLDRAWTLIAISKPKSLEEADALLTQAWNFRHHQDSTFQANLTKNIAVLHIQQQRFNDAQLWLNRANEILEQTVLEEPERLRQLIQIQYYQGEILFKTGAYQQAKEFYETALQYARTLNWIRAMYMIQNWLADIAICQGNFDDAKTLLMDGLHMAEANQDRTRIAFCQRSIAELFRSQGDLMEATRWANNALENFEALGMMPEAEETQSILHHLLEK